MISLLYFIFAAGIGNTVLRPEIENPLTLYRIVAPIGLLAVFALRPLFTVKWLFAFGGFAVYSVVLSTLYGGGYSELGASLVHYFYLFILALLMMHGKVSDPFFERRFVTFVQWFFVFLVANLVLEFLVGNWYPNLYVDESDEQCVRAFYWNQNDLAVVLCVQCWFVLAWDRFRGTVRNAVVAITVVVLFYNDSKAALLSLLFVSIPVYWMLKSSARTRIAGSVWAVVFGAIVTMGVIAIIQLSSVDIQFANDTYTLEDLLIRPITGILSLEATGEEWGSLNNRMDAAIFVIIEYVRSYGLGLGAGGSWLVLSLPQYALGGAQSPHNALLQFTVDFGYPVLLGYAWLIWWAIRQLLTPGRGENDRLRIIAILSFPLLGLSQSGAIVTNYFFFAIVYFIALLDRQVPFSAQASSTPMHSTSLVTARVSSSPVSPQGALQ